MIGKRGQAKDLAGKALGGTGKALGAAAPQAKAAMTGFKEASSRVGVAAIGASAYTLNKGAESLGQSKDALVDMGPSLFAFFLAVFAHTLSTGIIFPSNLFIASVLYTISFFLIAMSIIMRKSNPAKGRDLIIVVITFMIMGMVG